MTREEREALARAAQRAMERSGNQPWKLQTSNSFRRIGAHGDGDVICAILQRYDGQPDLLASPGVLDYLIAAQPQVVLVLLGALEKAERSLAQARALLAQSKIKERIDE